MLGNGKAVWIRTVSVMAVCLFALNAEDVKADFVFGEPVNLGPTVNSYAADAGPSVSSDGLSLYFNSTRAGGFGGHDLWGSTRETVLDAWGPAVNLGSVVNSTSADGPSRVSADNLELYFSSDRPGGSGNFDIYVTRRATTDDPWGEPVNLGAPINGPNAEWSPCISADGLT